MQINSFNCGKYAGMTLGILIVIFFSGCGEENAALQPEVSGGAAKPLDRDGQEYFFKLPEGCVPERFEVSYWMPSLGSDKTGPDPNRWKSSYMTSWEVKKRGIELEKVTITVKGVEKELTRDEKIVVLVVPERYEAWYNQAYGLEMFDDIRMMYKKETF